MNGTRGEVARVAAALLLFGGPLYPANCDGAATEATMAETTRLPGPRANGTGADERPIAILPVGR